MPCLAEELTSRVLTAYRSRSPLNITGAGTKDFLGQTAKNCTTLDVTGHNGIIEYDPAELILVARGGTPLREIEELLHTHHQMLGFEPPFADSGATLGGAVAAGLAGPGRAYSGAVRDHLLGVRFINGKGETATAGGKVMKNVAGFDLFRPMAGSMGTLGVLLEISLRVVPLPEFELSLLHEEINERSALEKMNLWTNKTQTISATTWNGRHIHIRLSGATAAVEHGQMQIGGEIGTEAGYWRDLNDFKLDFFGQQGRLWRISVAPMSGPVAENLPQLIDWGGAQRWLKTDAPSSVIRSHAARLGGHAECFSKDENMPTYHPLEDGLLTMNQRFKSALDPHGILNPGRKYPEV